MEYQIDVPAVDNKDLRLELTNRIEKFVLATIEQICFGQLPTVSYSLPRSEISIDTQEVEDELFSSSAFLEEMNTVDADESEEEETIPKDSTVNVNFACARSKDKFALMCTVMAAAHRLLISNATMNRRSLYYDMKNDKTAHLVPDQRYVDRSIHSVAHFLRCAPWDLGFVATSKGLAGGDLRISLADGRAVDCNVPGGAVIPQIISNVTSVRARAKFVLVVEKDTVFQTLLEEGCARSLNCLLITGKGYPDVATRMLVKLLSDNTDLPVYALVDADPFGVDIMCVYRFGSTVLARENSSLACPKMRWLGVHPSELVALGARTLSLTKADLSKLDAIENRPYINGELSKQLKILRKTKAEIESVASFSKNFLTATYLPCKIKSKDYV